MSTRPVTVSDRPDAPVVGSALGKVPYSAWCAAEVRRLAGHGLCALVERNHAGTRIHVAIVRPKGGRP
ncbi:MAG: hypothetical protein PHR35_04155 [Kiritimatiellae bacterium]|nr:hypothetical protein [Kiritimatiellia bacterium]